MTQQQPSKVSIWIASIYEERDAALARNRELTQENESLSKLVTLHNCETAESQIAELEHLAEVQDLDLQHAASAIKSLCANAKAESAEIVKLKKLIHDIYHAHFQNGSYLSYETWMELLTSTRSDMERIAEEQEGQEHAI